MSSAASASNSPAPSRWTCRQKLKSIARCRGFVVVSSERNDPHFPAGQVAGTDPAAGQQARRGSTVTMFVSLGPSILPVPDVIGQPEAESIVMQMHNIKRPRPLTHDLCKSLIVGLGGQVRKIHITRVENNTYFAELHVARGSDMVQIDARPSDSIAIALRVEAPIFASDDLLSDVQVEESSGEFPGAELKKAAKTLGTEYREKRPK